MKALEFTEGLRSNRLKDKLAIMQANLAASMAPLEQQRLMQQLMAGELDMNLTQAQIGATRRSNRPQARDSEPVRRNFGQLAPDERLDLQNSILEMLQPNMKTNQVVKLINSRIRTAGYNPIKNKQAKSFAYNTAKAAGLYPSWKWWGGR